MSALDTNIEKLNGFLDRFRETDVVAGAPVALRIEEV